MKPLLYIVCISFLMSCNSSKKLLSSNNNKNEQELALVSNDTVSIANKKLEYQILIIEPGFNAWLVSNARPEGYYSQSFLENRNRILVTEWNIRVNQPQRFNPNLYELPIDYNSNIDYGYDVNYKLYNYFVYFQLKYKQRLGPFLPRV